MNLNTKEQDAGRFMGQSWGSSASLRTRKAIFLCNETSCSANNTRCYKTTSKRPTSILNHIAKRDELSAFSRAQQSNDDNVVESEHDADTTINKPWLLAKKSHSYCWLQTNDLIGSSSTQVDDTRQNRTLSTFCPNQHEPLVNISETTKFSQNLKKSNDHYYCNNHNQSINVNVDDLRKKLYSFGELYLNHKERLNLHYYLEGYHTKHCDLDELIANLTNNLILKLSNSQIKQKLLCYVRKLYSNCDDVADDRFENSNCSKKQYSYKSIQSESYKCDKLFNDVNNLLTADEVSQRYKLPENGDVIMNSRLGARLSHNASRSVNKQEFSHPLWETLTATEQCKASLSNKQVQLLAGTSTTFNRTLNSWPELNRHESCQDRVHPTAAFESAELSNKLRNLSESLQQRQKQQQRHPIYPNRVFGDYESTNCGRRAVGAYENTGAGGVGSTGGRFVIVAGLKQSKGRSSPTTSSSNNLHPADNNNNNNSTQTTNNVTSRKESLDKFAREARSDSVALLKLTSNNRFFDSPSSKVAFSSLASFSSKSHKTEAPDNAEEAASLMENIRQLAHACEGDRGPVSTFDLANDNYQKYKTKPSSLTDGRHITQKREVMSSCSSTPHQTHYYSSHSAQAHYNQQEQQQQDKVNQRFRINDEIIRQSQSTLEQVHENDYQYRRNFRQGANKATFQCAQSNLGTKPFLDKLLYLNDEEIAHSKSNSVSNSKTRSNCFPLAQTTDPQIHSNSMLFGYTNKDNDNYSASVTPYQNQYQIRQYVNSSIQSDSLLDDQDSILSFSYARHQQQQLNLHQPYTAIADQRTAARFATTTKLQDRVGLYSRLTSDSQPHSQSNDDNDNLFTSCCSKQQSQVGRPLSSPVAVGQSSYSLWRWSNDELNLCRFKDNYVEQEAHSVGLPFGSSIHSMRRKLQSNSMCCLPSALEEEAERLDNFGYYNRNSSRHDEHRLGYRELVADSATRCLLDTSTPDSTPLSTSSSFSSRAQWQMNRAIGSNDTYVRVSPPTDYNKLDDRIKFYDDAENFEEAGWQERFAETTICDQCSCQQPYSTSDPHQLRLYNNNNNINNSRSSKQIDCSLQEPLHTSPQLPHHTSSSFVTPTATQLEYSASINYQPPHHQQQIHYQNLNGAIATENNDCSNDQWQRQPIGMNGIGNITIPMPDATRLYTNGANANTISPFYQNNLSSRPLVTDWHVHPEHMNARLIAPNLDQQLNQRHLISSQAQYFQNHHALLGVQSNSSLATAHASPFDLRNTAQSTAPSSGISSAFQAHDQTQLQQHTLVEPVQASFASGEQTQIAYSPKQNVIPSSSDVQRSQKRHHKRHHHQRPSSSLAIQKAQRQAQSTSFKSEENLYNVALEAQYNEDEAEDDESDSGLSLVASRRIPNSIVEQMGEEASNFVQHFGSTNTQMRKEDVRLRRTIPVKIKKSKPILGIAIEGGFNVSGQLLPRIVCVHEDGAAYQCGKLRASDLILEVNGKSTVNMTHDQIAETIADAYYKDPRSHIEFLIGESGFVTK